MSLRYAILSFLQVMPMTGYELKTQEFDHTVAHFWPAAQPQIYRELKSMEKDKLIKRTIEKRTSRPDRYECRITTAGKNELNRWLHSDQDPPKHREAFLIQLFFAAQLTNDEIIAMLEYQLQVHQERLAEIQQVQIPASTVPAEQRRQILREFTRNLGLRMEQAYIDWLTDCINSVEDGLPA